MKIAVTGRAGRLGNQLISMGAIPLVCDVTKEESVKNAIKEIQPDVVINCAAYTDVDGAETPDGTNKALKVNMFGVDNLMKYHPGKFIHISTDYVFGKNKGAFPENYVYGAFSGELSGYPKYDPISSYTASKIGGEVVFISHKEEEDVMVRTTGLYGGVSGRHDFSKLVISTLSEGKELKVTNELIGNQTYIPHLAEALLMLAEMDTKEFPSIINIASRDIVSRYEFALMIASVFELDKTLLSPCTNAQVPTWIAERPKKSGLKIKLAEKLGLPIYKIIDGLHDLRIEHDKTNN